MRFASFPMLALGVIAYNIVALVGSEDVLQATMFTIEVASGDEWEVRVADLFEVISLSLLFVELIRATATDQSAIVNHVLSMALFVVALVEFLLVRHFGNSTFFLLLVMLLLDVVAGFTITIIASRRDFAGEE